MKIEILIDKPDINVIKTMPSSLGRVDYFMVVCEQEMSKKIFNLNSYDSEGIWGDSLGNQVAVCVDDDDFDLPIFVLHASASDRAEPVQFITELEKGAEFFSKNVTYFDSAITLHCIAAKHSGKLIHLKTGFHSFQAGDPTPNEGPTSWGTMHMIYENDYKSIAVNYEAFRETYEPAKAVWLKINRNT